MRVEAGGEGHYHEKDQDTELKKTEDVLNDSTQSDAIAVEERMD